MEAKKTVKADLQNKRGLFLEIGLAVALVAFIGIFSWSQAEHKVEMLDLEYTEVQQEMVEITRQDTRPTEPPPQQRTVAVIADIINVVRNDTKIETTFDFAEFTEEVVAVVQTVAVRTEVEVEEDEPFWNAEEMASFQNGTPGDLTGFRDWVQTRLRYPAVASENGVSGTVSIQFTVERDGSVSNLQVLASPDRSLTEEAVRVLNTSPKWNPGKQRGQPVRINYVLPVVFRLEMN